MGADFIIKTKEEPLLSSRRGFATKYKIHDIYRKMIKLIFKFLNQQQQ